MTSISGSWARLHTWEKRFFQVSYAVAALLLTLGLRGDYDGFWGRHPFLMNTASSLAAFAASAPLVLVLFRRMAPALEHQVARRESDIPRVALGLIAILRTWRRTDNHSQVVTDVLSDHEFLEAAERLHWDAANIYDFISFSENPAAVDGSWTADQLDDIAWTAKVVLGHLKGLVRDAQLRQDCVDALHMVHDLGWNKPDD
jgi:hypothetical protein